MRVLLAELERLLDDEDVAAVLTGLEEQLGTAGRPRQLPVRSFVLGFLLAEADDRPAHLRRAHEALCALACNDQRRLGVLVGDHLLTYRQLEHLSRRLRRLLENPAGDGSASRLLAALCDALVAASSPAARVGERLDLALDWSDHASFARPRSSGTPRDPDAAWGHRKGTAPGESDGLFFGYYLALATNVAAVGAPERPECIVAMNLASCALDPVEQFSAVLERRAAAGLALGDVLADSGYAYRSLERFARPLRRLGAALVVDLHPNDRGPKGTFSGAVISNGRLYCPGTLAALLRLAPPARDATAAELVAHDRRCSEAAAFELTRLSADDADGYHRVACPALAGKCRCPLREASLAQPLTKPEVLTPPEHPPLCCRQKSLTVPVQVAEKTRQRHAYSGPAWRESYARRSAAERAHGSLKDPSRVDSGRGWCRMFGLVANALALACLIAVRNGRVVAAFKARRLEDERRQAAGLAPRRRRRRRRHANSDDVAPAPEPAPERQASTRPPP